MRLWADRKGGTIARLDSFDRSDQGTLASLVDTWLQTMRTRAYSARSVEAAQWALRSFLRWAHANGLSRPDAVTRALLDSFQRNLTQACNGISRSLRVSTQRARLGYVHRFFAWLSRAGHLTVNPAVELELPRRPPRPLPRALSLEEVRAVLAVPDVSDPLGVRDRAMLEVLYCTGIRRRELVMLDVIDVNLSMETLLVRHGKGNKERLVPLGERAAGWLSRYLADSRPLLSASDAEPALFLTGYGGRFNAAALGNFVRQLMNRVGIQRVGSCHLFRHSCATHMLERGADIRVIQQLLGHASLDSTAIYTNVSIKHLQEVHARCHPNGSGGEFGASRA